MKIWKLHALGNHFVFVQHLDGLNYPELARLLSRTAVSVGSDGLLMIDCAVKPPRVRMWNPDGSEDFCGNGMCCAVHLLDRLGFGPVSKIDTPYAAVPVRIEQIDRAQSQVTIEIGKGIFDPIQIPLAVSYATPNSFGFDVSVAGETLQLVPLNNGNMHSVIFINELPEDDAFFRFSPLIENHPLFPARTNVLWCVVRDGEIYMRIWERAVGETLACGTGSAAAVVASARAGIPLPESVQVIMRGGRAAVSLKPNTVALTTRVKLVFEGELIQDISTALVAPRRPAIM
ncbi:diaminopimelate epimerase [Sphingomonas sp. SORGH_AS 950]|uniref:diaminopimelate epimerase n=1 Tax=Sphingomonas sp. SORGH_AS_0950 TaxID=3041792 RepID=UPI0027846F6C|nr:diaminopimelate epimerase [Sphingomonas sp. SORGH_AS_0950]MDQ1159484.1 diaminopimelate epimerase [Sphingomonas sp. SORGH_AS_0950]